MQSSETVQAARAIGFRIPASTLASGVAALRFAGLDPRALDP